MNKERQSSFKEIKKVYSLCIIHPTTASQGNQAVNVWNVRKQSKKYKRNGNKVFFHVLATGTKLLNMFAQDGRMWDMKPSGRSSGTQRYLWAFHFGSERCSKDGFHWTHVKEGEIPPTPFPVGLQIVGIEGLAPGRVGREDLLMVLLSSYSCSWINH